VPRLTRSPSSMSATASGTDVSATVTQATRAPADGRRIVSPCCGDTRIVYHFAWWAIPCRGCDEAIIKYEWELL